jgi:hypothetical protein
MSEIIKQWHEIQATIKAKRAEIEALEKQAKALKNAMPKIFCVCGNDYKPLLSKGIHFAAMTKQDCIDWLLKEYPEMKMLNDFQFSSTAHLTHGTYEDFLVEPDTVDGCINEYTPLDKEWQEALVFFRLKKGGDDALPRNNP